MELPASPNSPLAKEFARELANAYSTGRADAELREALSCFFPTTLYLSLASGAKGDVSVSVGNLMGDDIATVYLPLQGTAAGASLLHGHSYDSQVSESLRYFDVHAVYKETACASIICCPTLVQQKNELLDPFNHTALPGQVTGSITIATGPCSPVQHARIKRNLAVLAKCLAPFMATVAAAQCPEHVISYKGRDAAGLSEKLLKSGLAAPLTRRSSNMSVTSDASHMTPRKSLNLLPAVSYLESHSESGAPSQRKSSLGRQRSGLHVEAAFDAAIVTVMASSQLYGPATAVSVARPGMPPLHSKGHSPSLSSGSLLVESVPAASCSVLSSALSSCSGDSCASLELHRTSIDAARRSYESARSSSKSACYDNDAILDSACSPHAPRLRASLDSPRAWQAVKGPDSAFDLAFSKATKHAGAVVAAKGAPAAAGQGVAGRVLALGSMASHLTSAAGAGSVLAVCISVWLCCALAWKLV